MNEAAYNSDFSSYDDIVNRSHYSFTLPSDPFEPPLILDAKRLNYMPPPEDIIDIESKPLASRMELELENNSQTIDAYKIVLELTNSSQVADLSTSYQTYDEADIRARP